MLSELLDGYGRACAVVEHRLALGELGVDIGVEGGGKRQHEEIAAVAGELDERCRQHAERAIECEPEALPDGDRRENAGEPAEEKWARVLRGVGPGVVQQAAGLVNRRGGERQEETRGRSAAGNDERHDGDEAADDEEKSERA